MALKYEYGYTIIADGETRDFIIGACSEEEKNARERDAKIANSIESGPNIRGCVQTQKTFHWIRPLNR